MKLSYSDLPSWAQWLVVLAIIVAAVVAIAGVVRSVWPIIVRMVRNLDTLEKLPDFMARTDDTLAAQDRTLAAQAMKIEQIHHEVNYNNGSSVKDAVSRVEVGVAGLYVRADASDKEAEDLRSDLENTRPVVRKRKPPTKKETP